MIKNASKRLKETQIIEVLDNGLTVLVVSKPEFRSNAAVIGTNFGAKNLQQRVNGRNQIYHAGLAHFLEHKLFEQEKEDILSVFTNIGASANAFTSYNETVYYFTNVDEIEEPLNILLDFVQSLGITESSVEKEKGIIVEELMMYQQIPAFQLSMELYKSLYHNHPLNQDIAGSKESVLAITKEELELAYQTNYHPSQMVLSIVTHHSAEEIIQLVKRNQQEKDFDKFLEVESVLVDEPVAVRRSYHEIPMNVNTPKVSIGYKQNKHFSNNFEMMKYNLSVRFLLEMTFTNLNSEYQHWIDQKLVNDFFNFQSNFGLDYGFIQFVTETNHHESFDHFMTSQLKNLKISESVLKQLIRRTTGELITSLQEFEAFAIAGLRAHFLEMNVFDLITLAEEITVEDLRSVREDINLSNKSIVKIVKSS